jgi:hypothetical protein
MRIWIGIWPEIWKLIWYWWYLSVSDPFSSLLPQLPIGINEELLAIFWNWNFTLKIRIKNLESYYVHNHWWHFSFFHSCISIFSVASQRATELGFAEVDLRLRFNDDCTLCQIEGCLVQLSWAIVSCFFFQTLISKTASWVKLFFLSTHRDISWDETGKKK